MTFVDVLLIAFFAGSLIAFVSLLTAGLCKCSSTECECENNQATEWPDNAGWTQQPHHGVV